MRNFQILIVSATRSIKNVCKLLQLSFWELCSLSPDRLLELRQPLNSTGDFRPPDPLGYNVNTYAVKAVSYTHLTLPTILRV